ncbi:MAG: hypothetical protein K5984_05315 [Bacteroidales bacterium]|nr:hypothetical protein [Bacteroidales bacterium]
MILSLIITILAAISGPDWTLLSPEDQAAVLEKAELASSQDVSADFTMERHSPLIDEVLTAEGHMKMKARKEIEWTVGEKKDIIAIRNFSLADRNAVKTTVEAKDGEYLITVLPVKKALKGAFSKVKVLMTKDMVPVTVKIETASGDWTLLTFSKVEYAQK